MLAHNSVSNITITAATADTAAVLSGLTAVAADTAAVSSDTTAMIADTTAA